MGSVARVTVELCGTCGDFEELARCYQCEKLVCDGCYESQQCCKPREVKNDG